MLRSAVLTSTALALAGAAAAADTCESLSAQIHGKIRDAGVEHFTLAVVDAAASAPGKVVGTCEHGAKKIVYLRALVADAAAATPSAPTAGPNPVAKPRSDAIVTECKDGTVSVGGRCGK